MIRSINQKQRAEYIGGSTAKGWYEYSVQGTERLGARLSYFEFIGYAATRQNAIKAAWTEAHAWEKEEAQL